MAQVFLSYERDDGAKAGAIASALEQAGHSVWWDRHIKGGAQYAKEIETALKAAEAVVVLWSQRSVESAWVRDEAAAGRDSGRLVPVRLDDTEAPMGFRQYQTVDFSGRGRRQREQATAELAQAVSALVGQSAEPRQAAPRKGPSKLKLGLLAALFVAFAAVLFWQFRSPGRGIPSVTVIASEGSAPTQSLAADLFVKLGSLQASRADSLQFVEASSGTNVDLSLKVGGVTDSGEPRANLALIDRTGTLLWSQEFKQPGGNQADLRQQIAYSAGQVLRCATDALAPAHSKLDLPTLKLFLNGCAHFSDMAAQDARTLVPGFQKVTDREPSFTAGWSMLILAQMLAHRQAGLKDAALRANLRTSIDRARKLHPQLAESDLAEAWLQAPRPISAWMRLTEKAVGNGPDHAEALMNRATGYLHVGLCQDAINDSRRAARAEPLYPAVRDALVETLAHCGREEEAKAELLESERLWPGATNMVQTRFWFEYQYGDPKVALRMLQSGTVQTSQSPAKESFLEARMDPSPQKIAEAVKQARFNWQGAKGYGSYLRTLAQFGRIDEAAQVLLATDPQILPGIIATLFGPEFQVLRRDPRFMKIAQRLELIPYWQETAKWADFCSEPDLPYDCKAEAAKLR